MRVEQRAQRREGKQGQTRHARAHTFGHVSDLLVILHLFDDGLHFIEPLVLLRPDDAFGVFLVIAEDEGGGLRAPLLLLGLGIGVRTRPGINI